MELTIKKISSVTPHSDDEWINEIPAAMKRRSPRIWRMAHVAVSRLLSDYPATPNSIAAATALGALDETVNFLNGSFTDGFGSPRNFIASVHNSMAGNLAMSFKIKGPNLTICDSQNSLASAIISAGFLKKEDFPLLLVAVDERTELLNELHPHFSAECKERISFDWTEGAIAMIIDLKKSTDNLTLSAEGPMPLNNLPVDKFIESISSAFNKDGYQLHDYKKASNSFIAPALELMNIFSENNYGKCIIPSYSPTSHSVSFIKIES